MTSKPVDKIIDKPDDQENNRKIKILASLLLDIMDKEPHKDCK